MLAIVRRKSGTALVVHWEVTSTVGIPYCEPCERHARWYQEQGHIGLVIRVLSAFLLTAVVGAFPLLIVFSFFSRPVDEPRPLVATAVILGLASAALVARRRLRLRPVAPIDARHASKGPAVELESLSDDNIVLHVAATAFADRIMRASPLATRQSLRPRTGPSADTIAQLAGLVLILLLGAYYYFVGW
jgi:hypothetical protein